MIDRTRSSWPFSLALFALATFALTTAAHAGYTFYPMKQWLGVPGYEPGARFGRATGRFPGCSGALVDDDLFVTARHCRNARTEIVVRFGLSRETYLDDFVSASGFWEIPGYYQGDMNYAKRRFGQIGMPENVAQYVPGPYGTNGLFHWRCDLIGQDYDGRDVDYWRCRPNEASWWEAGTELRYQDLLPGHIWGHFNVEAGVQAPKGDGTSMYVVQVNTMPLYDRLQTLMTAGLIEDKWATFGCADDSEGDYYMCFDHTAWTVSGSSGGPIVNRNTHAMFGVVNGHDHTARKGSYLGDRVYTLQAQSSSSWSLGGWGAITNWAGGTGGTLRELSCPGQTMASGVIGTTSDSGVVGNFGLVCTPHNDYDYMIDRSYVVAGGSLDTGFAVASPTDFNTYVNTVQSTTQGDLSVVMCAPGQFIYGMSVRAGAMVDQILTIYCQDPNDKDDTTQRSPYTTTNDKIGSYGGSYKWLACPADQYFAGLDIRAGWKTDGFRGICRYED